MADLLLKEKDKGSYITIYCLQPTIVNGVWDGKTTTPKDLTGLTVTLQMWVAGNVTPVVNGVCSYVGDPTNGIARYQLTGTDFITAGAFYLTQVQYSIGNSFIESSQTYTTQVLESA